MSYFPLGSQLLAKRPGGKVAHDISPSAPWTDILGDAVTFNEPLIPGIPQKFLSIKNKLDLTTACSAARDPLVTGENELTVKVFVGDWKRQPGSFDGLIGNNVIQTTMNADCGASEHLYVRFSNYLISY